MKCWQVFFFSSTFSYTQTQFCRQNQVQTNCDSIYLLYFTEKYFLCKYDVCISCSKIYVLWTYGTRLYKWQTSDLCFVNMQTLNLNSIQFTMENDRMQCNAMQCYRKNHKPRLPSTRIEMLNFFFFPSKSVQIICASNKPFTSTCSQLNELRPKCSFPIP